ncbi:hypothetical protein [Amycolatopsis nigrescens]|uniref:hypothetical protein n=1 Tax=Amycolatopsis nigrescens TaxID=381445 RepID=UPI00038216B0|nr:hypothetical protein [Amycolatopsis nigrescens]
MVQISLADFAKRAIDGFGSISNKMAGALSVRGGGGVEGWSVLEYLLLMQAEYRASLDYYREYLLDGVPSSLGGPRRVLIDLAFNVTVNDPTYPQILSEWKCKPDGNALSAGLFEDIDVFEHVLPYYQERGYPKPYPMVVGIGPRYSNPAPGMEAVELGNGVFLYLSTDKTWKHFNVYSLTAYA